jgi:hypothetical protein
MNNVKPKVGQVWDYRNNSDPAVIRSNVDGHVQYNRGICVYTMPCSQFVERFEFIPQNDLEWLAVNEPEWFYGDCNWIRRDKTDNTMYTNEPGHELNKKYTYYHRKQHQTMRNELGIDERPVIKLTKAHAVNMGRTLTTPNCRCVQNAIKKIAAEGMGEVRKMAPISQKETEMTFTLENTKAATEFYLGSEAYFEFFVMPDISHTESISNCFFCDSRLDDTPPDHYVSLVRPHNETREHWTTNGVTQYALGLKMIPIDYANNITPIVIGDGYYNSGQKFNKFVDQAILDRINNASGESLSNDHLFITSFTERPNTGTQPVSDDVVVDTCWSDGDSVTNKAGSLYWVIDNHASISTWKPNHAAMLKQYQAGQVKADTSKLDTSEIDALFNALLGGPVAPCGGEIPKPVFTQATADAMELPPVGAVCNTNAKASQCAYFSKFEGREVTILVHIDNIAVFSYMDDNRDLEYHGLAARKFVPIQTDEEKLRDKFIHFYQKGVNDELCIDDAADELLSEFTITLKG